MKMLSSYKGFRKEVYVLALCTFIDNAGAMAAPLLTIILSAKLGMSAENIALYLLITTFVSLPMRYLGGWAADRFNKRTLVIVLDIISGISYILSGYLGFSRTTLLLYLFGSVLQTTETPIHSSMIADFSTPAQRDGAYSLQYLCMNLGVIIAPILGGFLLNSHMNMLFIISGIVELVSVGVFVTATRDPYPSAESKRNPEKNPKMQNILGFLRNNRLILGFFLVFSVGMSFYYMLSYLLPITLQQVHGETGTIIYGTLLSINAITVAALTAAVTTIFAGFASLRRMMLGTGFELVGFLLILFFQGIAYVYYAAFVVFSIGEIINTITAQPYLTKRVPAELRARMVALLWISVEVVSSLGKFCVGKVFDSFGMSVSWALVIVIGFLVIFGYFLLQKIDTAKYPNSIDSNGNQ